jgi:hypothetical protein
MEGTELSPYSEGVVPVSVATTVPWAFTNPSVYGPTLAEGDATTASGLETTVAVGVGLRVVAGTSVAGSIEEVGVVATLEGEATTDGLGAVAAEAHPTIRVDPTSRLTIALAAAGILAALRLEPMLGAMTNQRERVKHGSAQVSGASTSAR